MITQCNDVLRYTVLQYRLVEFVYSVRWFMYSMDFYDTGMLVYYAVVLDVIL